MQAIATCCNLQGLNLKDIPITDITFCIKAWEILSTMSLTHLSMDASFIRNNLTIAEEKQIVAFFARCTMLRALELHSNHSAIVNYKLLSHFPSLEYCRLNSCRESTCTQDILITCKMLKFFYCYCWNKLSLLSVHNKSLEQLCIASVSSDLDSNFMKIVSAHGGLVHVALFVNSVPVDGITSLIKNSPNLLTFVLLEQKMPRKLFRDIKCIAFQKIYQQKALYFRFAVLNTTANA